MICVIGVRFKKAGKIYYFDPDNLDIEVGQHAIVETVRGIELGEVAVAPRMVPDEEIVQPLKKVLRIATDDDLDQVHDNTLREQEAYEFAQERIHALGLEMKLVEIEYTFDKNKLVFYFTADKRIDFRELVKDLAAKFRTRIELRQIGVRDEAKMLGGLGVCGQALCCTTWMGDFAPVSIRHAKDQDLSMNPNKISGVCGRLKCCLRFEADAYEDARARQPKIGESVMVPAGEAHVVAVNLLRESCTLQVPDGARCTLGWNEISYHPCTAAKGEGPCAHEADDEEPELHALETPDDALLQNSDEATHESTPNAGTTHHKPRRSGSKHKPTEAEAKAHVATQEIAAGSDGESHPPRKRRRWRKRKPKNGDGKESPHATTD